MQNAHYPRSSLCKIQARLSGGSTLSVKLDRALGGGQTALVGTDTLDGSIHTAKLLSVAVGEGVHGGLGHVDTGSGTVDTDDVDALAVVGDLEALTARGRVPSGDVDCSADVWEACKVVSEMKGWEQYGCV